jgi:hypothetical protein
MTEILPGLVEVLLTEGVDLDVVLDVVVVLDVLLFENSTFLFDFRSSVARPQCLKTLRFFCRMREREREKFKLTLTLFLLPIALPFFRSCER